MLLALILLRSKMFVVNSREAIISLDAVQLSDAIAECKRQRGVHAKNQIFPIYRHLMLDDKMFTRLSDHNTQDVTTFSLPPPSPQSEVHSL